MKAVIHKCSVDKYWYKDKIGESFPMVDDKKFEIREDKDNANSRYVVIYNNKEHVVVVEDCEVIA